MYKILVPVDFSEKSEFAVKMSAQIGKKIKTEGVTSICKSEFFNFQKWTLYIKSRH